MLSLVLVYGIVGLDEEETGWHVAADFRLSTGGICLVRYAAGSFLGRAKHDSWSVHESHMNFVVVVVVIFVVWLA